MTPLIYALLGGILPACIWLLFWLREDKKSPEPKYMIVLAFLGGIAAVFISLYFEKIVAWYSQARVHLSLSYFYDSQLQVYFPSTTFEH